MKILDWVAERARLLAAGFDRKGEAHNGDESFTESGLTTWETANKIRTAAQESHPVDLASFYFLDDVDLLVTKTLNDTLTLRSNIMAKTEGKWRTKTVAEFEQTKHVVWRAQLSIAPDGKKFAGVRKYIKKRDGSEIADRAGITFAYDDSFPDNLSGIRRLFDKLAFEITKPKTSSRYVFMKQDRNNKFLVNYDDSAEAKASNKGRPVITTATAPFKAKSWASAEEAENWARRRIDLEVWEVVRVSPHRK